MILINRKKKAIYFAKQIFTACDVSSGQYITFPRVTRKRQLASSQDTKTHIRWIKPFFTVESIYKLRNKTGF